MDHFSFKISFDFRNIRLRKVSISHDYKIVHPTEDRRAYCVMDLDRKLLLSLDEVNLENSVLEMNIWRQAKMLNVALDVLMELVHCEK